jgi:hypothetical protein
MESQNQFQQPQYQTSLPNGTAVLVLGIISIVGSCCYGIVGVICGIIALVLAKKDMNLYNANPNAYTPGSYSNLKAGRVCGIVGLCLSAVYVLVIICYIIFVGTAILSDPQYFFHNH